MTLPVTYADVETAAEHIHGLAAWTPLLQCRSIDDRAGNSIVMKCENWQRTGSFKFRGASHAVARLNGSEKARGVTTHSSGNHAQALALAAKLHGVPATIVMPRNASAVKRAATEGYGARIVECDATVAAREAAAAAVVAETGATLIHPYDHPHIVAGQGTAALEMLHDRPDLEAVFAPVGGGGLLSGTALVALGFRSRFGREGSVAVFGCEPAQADDAFRSLQTGERVTEQTPQTIADGLRTTLGKLNFALLAGLQVPILRVSEDEIREAMQFVWERAKILIEPSSAVAIAPLLNRQTPLHGKKVGVILSGGNVDARSFIASLQA
ncbi:MAG: threonine ammonia-lyase [Planctomycetota bacterium]